VDRAATAQEGDAIGELGGAWSIIGGVTRMSSWLASRLRYGKFPWRMGRGRNLGYGSRSLADPGSNEHVVSSPGQQGSAESNLIEALNAYREVFAAKHTTEPNSAVAHANAVLGKARKIIRESGLGAALAPTLIEETRYWNTWQRRDDFMHWVNFPALEISAEENKTDKGHTPARSTFMYNSQRYSVKFIDEGLSSFIPDNDEASGKAEFYAADELVLGLDVSRKIYPDSDRWRWINVYAFKSGAWMKDLIEISTLIDKTHDGQLKQIRDNDLISRARNIEL